MTNTNDLFSEIITSDVLQGKSRADQQDRLLQAVRLVLAKLPDRLTLEEATPLADAISHYVAFGEQFVHLARYVLGAVAYRVKMSTGITDPIGTCADAWGIDDTTLRLYVRCAKVTRGDVMIFKRYLDSEVARYKTQKDLRAWSSLMKDPEIMPEEAAARLRERRYQRAMKDVEETIESERDDDTRRTRITVLAQTAGVDVEEVDPAGVARELLDLFDGDADSGYAYAQLDIHRWRELCRLFDIEPEYVEPEPEPA